MSDTPRVDAICKKRNCAYWGIPRSNAEDIERDLNVALAERDALRANFQEYRDRAEQAEQNNAELAAQMAMLIDLATDECRAVADMNYSKCWRDDDGFKVAGDTAMQCESAIRKALANLPAEAEKVRNAMEAVQKHYEEWNGREENEFEVERRANHRTNCPVCQAARALNPEPPK